MHSDYQPANTKDEFYQVETIKPPQILESSQLLNTAGEATTDIKAGKTKERRAIIIRQMRFLALILFIDIGLPLAIYYVFKIFTTVLIALICSGIPPLLRVFYVAIRYRKIDFLSVLCVLAFVISGVLSIVTGDIRATLLRDSFTTLVIGLAFLITLIPLRTKWFTIYPLTHLISQQMYAEAAPVTWVDQNNTERSLLVPDWLWENAPFHRKFAYTLTALWGIFLCLEFVSKVIMIYTNVSPDHVVLFGSIILAVIAVALFTFSTFVVIRLRKRYAEAETEWRKTNDFTSTLRPQSLSSEEAV